MKEKKVYNASETHVSLENLQRFKTKTDESYASKSHYHDVATTEVNGYMSAGDKNKLDNLNNYVHPDDANTRHISDNEKGSILQYRGVLDRGTDFNLLVSNGMYQAQDLVIENFVGLAGSFYGWGQFTVRSTNVAIEQTYTAHQLGIILRRHSWDGGGTWGVWDYVYTSQNKPTPADIGAVSKNGDSVHGTLSVAGELAMGASDLTFKASDSGDIVFTNESNVERGRIWSVPDGGINISGSKSPIPTVTIAENALVSRKSVEITDPSSIFMTRNAENGFTYLESSPTTGVNVFLGGTGTRWFDENAGQGFWRGGSTDIEYWGIHKNGNRFVDYNFYNQTFSVPSLKATGRSVISANTGGTGWGDAQLELNSGGDGSVSLSLHRPGHSHVALIHDAVDSLKVNMNGGTHTMWHSGNFDPNRVMYRDRSNHGDGVTHGAVIGQLAWRAHGNGHTIFDASAGVSPDGGAVDPTNSQIAWAGSYPTLMGWNGLNTYGVRVDNARYSDSSGYSNSSGRVRGDSGGGSHVSWRERDTIVQVDCPASGGAASNVWKATNWGSHHVAACDVYDEMIRWVMHTDQVISFNKYGDFVSSGNIIAYSDIRLKKDLEIIPNALEKITALNGYTYTRKDTGLKQTGVVAQEVEKVLPEAIVKTVEADGEETLGVAYGNMVGLLIEGIKELKKEVEFLKEKLSEQEFLQKELI